MTVNTTPTIVVDHSSAWKLNRLIRQEEHETKRSRRGASESFANAKAKREAKKAAKRQAKAAKFFRAANTPASN